MTKEDNEVNKNSGANFWALRPFKAYPKGITLRSSSADWSKMEKDL